MSKKNSNIGNVIIGILSLLLVVAVVGFIFKFTNGLNEDLKTFYIEHNGKQIVATDSQMTFDTSSEHRFDCKYISNPDNNTFNLKVVPNVTEETDFNYTVDGKTCKWSEIKNLTACFTLDKQANYFIISFPADFSMQSVLNSLYPESEVVISDTLSLYQYYYTLHVSNYNEKINYYIDFNVCNVVNYVALINEQLDIIGQLDNEIDVLENQLAELETSSIDKNTQIADLQKQISALNNDKTVLEDRLSYYEDYISTLESKNAVITLEVDGSVYALFVMAKGSTMFDISIPESVDYEFNGWTVNGEQVDLQGYLINENTTFVADLTHWYDISFVIDEVTIKTERVIEDTLITPPEPTSKEGYSFVGWVTSNNDFIDFSTYLACEDMCFSAYYVSVDSFYWTEGAQVGQVETNFNMIRFRLNIHEELLKVSDVVITPNCDVTTSWSSRTLSLDNMLYDENIGLYFCMISIEVSDIKADISLSAHYNGYTITSVTRNIYDVRESLKGNA